MYLGNIVPKGCTPDTSNHDTHDRYGCTTVTLSAFNKLFAIRNTFSLWWDPASLANYLVGYKTQKVERSWFLTQYVVGNRIQEVENEWIIIVYLFFSIAPSSFLIVFFLYSFIYEDANSFIHFFSIFFRLIYFTTQSISYISTNDISIFCKNATRQEIVLVWTWSEYRQKYGKTWKYMLLLCARM